MWLRIVMLILFGLFSCKKDEGQGSGKQNSTIVRGYYGASGQYSYSVFLPSGYSPRQTYPLILAADPHGRGRKAPELFREPADAYGYIVAGLHDFTSGTPKPAKALMDGLQAIMKRYAVDNERVILFGFSGGARVAGSLASAVPEVRSVLLAGAGFDVRHNMENKKDFHVFLAIGKRDFNYLEMRSLKRELAGAGIDRHLEVFPGAHAYPPEHIAQAMIVWEEFKAMRNKMTPVNKKLVREFTRRQQQRIDSLMKRRNFYKAYKELSKTINFLEGLSIPRQMLEKYRRLEDNPHVQEHKKEQKRLERFELQMQQTYYKAAHQKNRSWWKKQVKSLKLRIADAHGLEKDVQMRLMNFLRMVFFTETRKAFKTSDYRVERFIELYGLVGADNPDYLFFKAKLEAQQGDSARARKFLAKSLTQDFMHNAWIQQDSALFEIYREIEAGFDY